MYTSEAESAMQKCVSVDTLPGTGYPDHFFEVRVDGIARYAAGSILNRDAVRAYIGEVCPVPMQPTFPFLSRVENLFEKTKVPLILDIVVDNEQDPVVRQYGEAIRFSGGRKDYFTELSDYSWNKLIRASSPTLSCRRIPVVCSAPSCRTMGPRFAIDAIRSVGHAPQDKGFN